MKNSIQFECIKINDEKYANKKKARPEAYLQSTVKNISKPGSITSETIYIQTMPWKIIIKTTPMSIGIFIVCGIKDNPYWNCFVEGEIKILPNNKKQEPLEKNICKLFYQSENNSGYVFPLSDVLDPAKGLATDDKIKIEVHIVADAPKRIIWNSKINTGFIGLFDNSPPNYSNSVIQALYFTELKEDLKKITMDKNDGDDNAALALKKLFHEMEYSDKPVCSNSITKKFENLGLFSSKNPSKFLNNLINELQSNTSIVKTITKLFQGELILNNNMNTIKIFYSLQLKIQEKSNIYDALDLYLNKKKIDSEPKKNSNKAAFKSLPSILLFDLMRFQNDMDTNCCSKKNIRFEYFEELNLNHYLHPEEPKNSYYKLHAVLAHGTDRGSEKYVVYINPAGDGKWIKCDDEKVSQCTEKHAILNNYSSNKNTSFQLNASLLMYKKISKIKDLVCSSKTGITSEDLELSMLTMNLQSIPSKRKRTDSDEEAYAVNPERKQFKNFYKDVK